MIDARNDPRITPWLGKLVRFEVGAGGFSLTAATAEEAEAHWEKRRQNRPVITPALDASVRGIVPLEGLGLASLPYVGAKAAQLAELSSLRVTNCGAPLRTPQTPFAIPVSYYLNHFRYSGAEALLNALLTDPATLADPTARWAALAGIR